MTDPNHVVLAGDWHGNFGWARHVISLLPTLLPDEESPLILHAGDFGVWPGVGGKTFLEVVDKALEAVNGRLWFVDGNHEWFPRLHGLLNIGTIFDLPEWPVNVSWRTQWLPRGYRWTWHDKTWLALGGAVSVDKALRTEGHDWWPEEEITDADATKALVGGPVDVMLCHDAPSEVQMTMGPWPRSWDVADEVRSNAHRRRLQGVVSKLEPSLFIHGHYHQHVRQFSQETGMDVIGLNLDGVDDNYTVLNVRHLVEE